MVMQKEVRLWGHFIVILVITLPVKEVISNQTVEFDPSLKDTIYINKSQTVVSLDVVKTGNVHTNIKITYNVILTSSKISFPYQSAALDFGKDSVKQVNITINSDRLQADDEFTIELSVSGNAMLGKKNTIKIVILEYDDVNFTRDPPAVTDTSKELYKPLDVSSGCSYHDCKGNKFVDQSKIRQQEIQAIRGKSIAKSFRTLEAFRHSKVIRKRQLDVASTGSDFYIGFVPIYGCPLYIFLATGSAEQANYSVTVATTNFYQTGTIIANAKGTVCLPRSLTGPSYNYLSNSQNNAYKEGIYLQTHGDEVAAIGSYIYPYIDTFFAIPTVDLCIYEYIYYAVSTDGHSGTDGSVVIVGTADQTTVNITVPVTTVIKISSAANWTTLNATTSETYTIQRLQIVYIATQGNNDLTGTKVTTNKPISLFSGHECVINAAINYCDTLIEQLPPTKLWGRIYYFAPLHGWSSYKIKIIAAYDSTTVRIYCNNAVSNNHTVHSGKSISLSYNLHYCGVFATKEILVIQFSYASNSESLMTIIPPTDHYTNSITSSTPNNYFSLSYNHYVNIIVLASSYQQNMMSITTAGGVSQLNTQSWIPIIVNGIAEAYVAHVMISQGVFKVTHADMDALMTIVVYGQAVYSNSSFAIYPSDSFPEGYGHPGWLMSQLIDAVVSLEHNEYLVTIDDSPLTIVVTLNDITPQDVIIQVNITDGTALAGIDYNVTAQVFNLTIPTGNTTASISIDIIDNIIDGDHETFNVAITLLPSCLSLSLGLSQTTIKILDNETTVICFDSSSVSVNEDVGLVTFAVLLTHPFSTNITITAVTTDITTGNHDYESGPFNFVIPAGETRVPVSILITTGRYFEQNELFTVTIDSSSLPERVFVEPDCLLVVTLVNDDEITVTFDNTLYSVNENDGVIQPTLLLSNPSIFFESVQVISADITAIGGGVDYNSGPYTVIFPVSSTIFPFDIMIHDDGILEGDEMFNVTIGLIVNGHIVGTPGVATITIIDTTILVLHFTLEQYNTAEAAECVKIEVMFSGGISTFPVTVLVTPTEISADGSYVDFDSEEFNITVDPGEIIGSYCIPITCDNLVEDDESFNLTFSLAYHNDQITTGQSTAVVQIADSKVVVDFNQSLYYHYVRGKRDTVKINLTMNRQSPQAFDVIIRVVDTTITDGDYDRGNITVNIPAGVVSVSFMIDVMDDFVECNETFYLIIDSLSTCRATIGNINTSEIIIIDDDDIVEVNFKKSSYYTREDNATLMIELILNRPSSKQIEIFLQVIDTTTTEAGYIRENISVPAGVSSESFILDITDNDIIECKKSYSVTIESVSTCGVVIGSVNRSEVIIIDNDDAFISFEQPEYLVTNRNNTLSVVLTMSDRVSQDVVVEVTITDGTATAGMNYITTTSVLNVTIPAGEVSTSFVIEIIENVIQEDIETFSIAITMIQNCSSLSLDISSSIISIIDNNVQLHSSAERIIILEKQPVDLECIPTVTDLTISWKFDILQPGFIDYNYFTFSPLNHTLTISDPRIEYSGEYICQILYYHEINRTITLEILSACQPEYRLGLFWERSRTNRTVHVRCSEFHPSFQSGVYITRMCNNHREWEDIDFSGCTMRIESTPVILLEYTHNTLNMSSSEVTYEITQTLEDNGYNDISHQSPDSSVNTTTLLVTVNSTIFNNITTILLDNLNFQLTFITAFQPKRQCNCKLTALNNSLNYICIGPSVKPCSYSNGTFECNRTAFAGNGMTCGLDSDGDGRPDEQLNCTQMQCNEDPCPYVYNTNGPCPNSMPEDLADGCHQIVDMWGIQWHFTNTSTMAVQRCPGTETAGLAYRHCLENAEWEMTTNVSQCYTVETVELNNRANELHNILNNNINNNTVDYTTEFDIMDVKMVSDELAELTRNTGNPILPNDLSASNNIVNTLISIVRTSNDGNTTSQNTMDLENILENVTSTVDNLLSKSNEVSYHNDMQASIAEDLLGNVETLAVTVGEVLLTAISTNSSKEINKSVTYTGKNENIVINAQLPPSDLEQIKDIEFPEDYHTQIFIPANAIIHQRLTEGIDIPVVNFYARNLQSYLDNQLQGENKETAASMVISSQISKSFINLPANSHVRLEFDSLENVTDKTTVSTRCVFWNFTMIDNQTGGWSSKGIIQDTTPGLPVLCNSTHLTSFAVLVSNAEMKDPLSLSVVSYFGCAVSIVCLLLTTSAILYYRKTAFKGKHNLVHWNLCIALLLGLIVFVSGIETAREDHGGCIFVATLLHYLFLAVFCWMLCEAIIIYVKFIALFYKGIFQKMYTLLIIGWVLPILVTALSVGISYKKYGLYDNGHRYACWISDEDGAIWAFTAPMILIVLLNLCVLSVSVYKIYQSQKRQNKMTSADKSRLDEGRIVLLSIVALLPLLGGTWILGLLFVASSNSDALAWIFTIVNSLQGLFIFYFHVVRNKEMQKTFRGYLKHIRKDKMQLLANEETKNGNFIINRLYASPNSLSESNVTSTSTANQRFSSFIGEKEGTTAIMY